MKGKAHSFKINRANNQYSPSLATIYDHHPPMHENSHHSNSRPLLSHLPHFFHSRQAEPKSLHHISFIPTPPSNLYLLLLLRRTLHKKSFRSQSVRIISMISNRDFGNKYSPIHNNKPFYDSPTIYRRLSCRRCPPAQLDPPHPTPVDFGFMFHLRTQRW